MIGQKQVILFQLLLFLSGASFMSIYIPIDSPNASSQNDLSFELFQYFEGYTDYDHTWTILQGSGPSYVVQSLGSSPTGNYSILVQSQSGIGGNFTILLDNSVVYDSFSLNQSWGFSIQVDLLVYYNIQTLLASVIRVDLEPIVRTKDSGSNLGLKIFIIVAIATVLFVFGSAVVIRFYKRNRDVAVHGGDDSVVFDERIHLPEKHSIIVGESDVVNSAPMVDVVELPPRPSIFAAITANALSVPYKEGGEQVSNAMIVPQEARNGEE